MDACVIWTGNIDSCGYGRYGDKKAHRLAYEQAYGKIPESLTIDHLCRNRACVNPNHLEAVTNKENLLRGLIGAHNFLKTHCPNGHELKEPNLRPYQLRIGKRSCKICQSAHMRAYKKSWL